MRKAWKKAVSVLLTLVLIFGVLPAMNVSAEGEGGQGSSNSVEITLDNGTYDENYKKTYGTIQYSTDYLDGSESAIWNDISKLTASDDQGKPKYTIQGENVYIKITYAQDSTYKATIPNSGEVEDGAAIKITGGIHIEFTNFSAGGGSQGGNPPQPTGVSLQFEGNAWSSYQNLKLYAGLELYVNPDNTGFVALTDLLNQKKAAFDESGMVCLLDESITSVSIYAQLAKTDEYVIQFYGAQVAGTSEDTAITVNGTQHIQIDRKCLTVTWAYDDTYGEDGRIEHGTAEIIKINGQDVSQMTFSDFANNPGNEKGGHLEVKRDDVVTIKLIPDYGYQLSGASINGVELEALDNQVSTFTFTMPDTNVHFKGIFTQTQDEIKTSGTKVSSASVENGANAAPSGNLRLTVEDSDANTTNALAQVENAVSAEAVNLTLDQIVSKGDGTNWENPVTQFDQPVKMKLQVADYDTAAGYEVVREHNGNLTKLTTSVSENGTLTFETNQFSTYFIVKTDSKQPDLPEETNGAKSIYINENGILFDDENAPEYWKVASDGTLVEANQNNYAMHYQKSGEVVTLTFRNFQFTGTEGDAIWSNYPLKICLEGTNAITSTSGNAIGIGSTAARDASLTIEGTGTLAFTSTSGEVTPEDGSESFVPNALYVDGRLTNHSTVVCKSNNEEATVVLACDFREITNTGTLTIENNGKLACNDMLAAGLKKPETYSGITDYPKPTDHVYIAKAYYYTPEEMYPNQHMELTSDSEWRIYGKYDNDGNPIGSHVWYQWWYVDKNGGPLTEDIKNPTQYLVYEENPENLIQDKDIVSIQDGKSHTFNADIYALWFTDGDVTVNGNIIQDFACANVAERKEPSDGSDEHLEYVWNNGKRVWTVSSTENSRVTVNGNVGLLSLNQSFVGNVTVSGNVDLIGYYQDEDPGVIYTDSFVPETFYGSKVSAGAIIQKGKYVGVSDADVLDGYQGYRIYNTEDFYSITERTIEGEQVHGTASAVSGQSVIVDVSDSIGTDTYPCVKNAGKAREKEILKVLSDKSKTPMVMDISLICDNTKKVEPEAAVNLYLGNIKGYQSPAIYHVKDDGSIEKLGTYTEGDVLSGKLKCSTNSFSTYFVAENQKLLSDKISDGSNTVDKGDQGSTDSGNHGNKESKNSSSSPAVGTQASNNITAEVTYGTDASVWKIMTTADQLLNLAKLSEDEKKAVKAGNKTQFVLSASGMTPTKEEIALIQSVLENNVIGQYLNLNLTLKISGRADRQITDLSAPMYIAITIPQNLVNHDSSIERTYRIVRIHDGVATLIDGTYDVATNQFTFATDGFSTYALVYEDVNTTLTGRSPKTGDSSMWMVWTLILCAGCGALFAAGKRYKKREW